MAKRTGGPKTAEGKLVSSKNALKTGAYSDSVLLPQESKEDFENLRDQFIKDFSPQDAVEMNLVQDLVEIAWKQTRLRNIERSYLIQKLNEPFQDFEVVNCQQLSSPVVRENLSALDLTEEQLNEYSREYDFAEELIAKDKFTEKDFKKIREDYPQLHKFIESYKLPLRVTTLDGADLLNVVIKERYFLDEVVEVVKDDELIQTSYGAYALGKAIETFDTLFHIRNFNEVIKEEIRYIRNERYMRLMQSDTYVRAHEDLRRAFSRILQEYRKHQDWKLRTKSIEVSALPIYKTD